MMCFFNNDLVSIPCPTYPIPSVIDLGTAMFHPRAPVVLQSDNILRL